MKCRLNQRSWGVLIKEMQTAYELIATGDLDSEELLEYLEEQEVNLSTIDI